MFKESLKNKEKRMNNIDEFLIRWVCTDTLQQMCPTYIIGIIF